MDEKAASKKFLLAAGILAAVFSPVLWSLARFAWRDELHSYIVLIPAVSWYLARLQKNLPPVSVPAKFPAAIFSLAGLGLLAWHWFAPRAALADHLAQTTLAFVLLLAATGFWFLGAARMRARAFPFALLLFLVPLPDAGREAVEVFLQNGSAWVAGWMFEVSDLPVLQTGLQFKLPGMTPLQVAPECSGIHSTLVLLITSLVAGNLFLQRPWSRATLCLAVIPLALLRNGFRIFVLGELCVHIGPHMIDSPIHHRGGPLFFALSLLPFCLLLYWLRRKERAAKPVEKINPKNLT